MKSPITIEIQQILDRKDIKSTPNRILVLKEFIKTSHPLTLANLESLLEFSMDKASIFRVLELFARKDVVHVIEDGSRSSKYELCRSDSQHSIGDQHIHFYCEKCKNIFCFEDQQIPIVDIPEGFNPHSINYMIKGICPDCAKTRR